MKIAYTDPVAGMTYDRDDPYWRDIVELGFRVAECLTTMDGHTDGKLCGCMVCDLGYHRYWCGKAGYVIG